MTNLSTRIGQRWDVIALVVAVVAGQVVQSVLPPEVVALAIAAVLAVVIIALRVRLGIQLAAAARRRAFRLPTPESLPARYTVSDPSGRLVNGLLAVLDLALLLLVQNTLRRPILALAGPNLPRGWVETGFVGLVLLIAVVLLVKLYSAAKPVAALLLWWGLDRVVPTAGFLGARPQVAAPKTATALGTAHTPTPARVAGTPAATVVSSADRYTESVDREAATVVSVHPSSQSDSEAPTEVSAAQGRPNEAANAGVAPSTGGVNPTPARQSPIAEQDTPTVISPHVHSGSANNPDAAASLAEDNRSRPSVTDTSDESTVVSEPRDR